MKKSIEVSSNIETLFGTRDENLHVLEDGLNITIDLRSNGIQVEGAPRDVARDGQCRMRAPRRNNATDDPSGDLQSSGSSASDAKNKPPVRKM